MTIEVESKVKTRDGDGHVLQIRRNDAGLAVAQVLFNTGADNWYAVADLTEIPEKRRYVRPRQ